MAKTMNDNPNPFASPANVNVGLGPNASSSSARKRRIGAISIAQSAIFNTENGEDSRALKPSYRSPLPWSVKAEEMEEEEKSQVHMGISPEPPVLRKMMHRIQSAAEASRKPRNQKSNPDESDSDMSNIEDNPLAANVPRYGHPKPGQYIDDRTVMNYPTPPKTPKKKCAAAPGGNGDEHGGAGAGAGAGAGLKAKEMYGGYPAPLAVLMQFFCNPHTPPISKIERARMDPASLARPGPPAPDDAQFFSMADLGVDGSGLAVGSGVKQGYKRITCKGPPRVKGKYTWKGGVAPKRRLGHVKRGDYGVDVGDEEMVEEFKEEDGWMDGDDESVLLDDDSSEDEGSEKEDDFAV